MSKYKLESYWISYEGALGSLSVCAAMTEAPAREMADKVLKTGLVPRLCFWFQDKNGDRHLKEELRAAD